MKNLKQLTEKLQELEEEARTMHKLDIENLYTDLGAYYAEGYDTLDVRQKLLFMLAFNHYTIQEAANILGYKTKKSVTEACSQKLFRYLKELLRVDKIMWNNIFSSIKIDKGYINH